MRQLIKYIRTYYQFLKYQKKEILTKNIELKNTGFCKRAFLLATGPSIKNQNLKLLNGADCFTVSNFFLHKDILTVNPKFHFFAPYHVPLNLDKHIQWLKKSDEMLPSETSIFLGHKDFELVKKYKLFPERKIFYMYLGDVPYSKIDLQRICPVPQTVPLMVLNLLIYMNYKEIYLLGCDHNILKYYNQDVENFYDSNEDIRLNATDKKTVWDEGIDIRERMRRTIVLLDKYEYIADKHKIKFYNLSYDSWIDFFERKKLEDVFTS